MTTSYSLIWTVEKQRLRGLVGVLSVGALVCSVRPPGKYVLIPEEAGWLSFRIDVKLAI